MVMSEANNHEESGPSFAKRSTISSDNRDNHLMSYACLHAIDSSVQSPAGGILKGVTENFWSGQ